MTSFPIGVLIVVAAAQAPGETPAGREPRGPAPALFSIAPAAETAVGTEPYKRLCTASRDSSRKAQERLAAQVEEQAVSPRSRIVCGMRVIQADPVIDPKIVHRSSADANRTFHIKKIPPTTCAD
jgi:hypothetical protein